MGIPKKWWQGALHVLLTIGIFLSGYYFHDWMEENINYKIVSIYSPDEVSSAITDRWELQLTDHITGQVRIYNKNILDAIYHQYSARRAYTQEDKISE